jgi:iron complex transport system ATP-binding protein
MCTVADLIKPLAAPLTAPLTAQGLNLRIDGAQILEDIGLHLAPASLTVIIGPNGAGKTSLLRCLAGLEAPSSGHAALDGKDVQTIPAPQRARSIGYLPQSQSVAWPIAARDVVALGRFAYGISPARLSQGDRNAIDAAMTSAGCAHLADRALPSLSGGEAARVHLARLLAGEAPILLADEPIAALDPRHQRDTLAVFKMRAAAGATVVLILHDLTLAAAFADQLIWMHQGRIVAQGSPAETMTADNLKAVFDLTAAECGELFKTA